MSRLLGLDPRRRNAILDAALKEFSSQGYDKASTNVIAKEAGISEALMFHYAGNKQDLFLVVYDYFADLIKKEYLALMNYTEKDIFNKLRRSYLWQIKLSEKHPWILEFNKLSRATHSNEVNKELEKRTHHEHANCYPKLFDEIDVTMFKKVLDINNVYAGLVHLQTGSIQVSIGQGDVIGKVGHSGNSFSPHLHFQHVFPCCVKKRV